MLAHALRENTKPNTREVVDGKPCVTRVFQREETLEAGLEDLVLHLIA